MNEYKSAVFILPVDGDGNGGDDGEGFVEQQLRVSMQSNYNHLYHWLDGRRCFISRSSIRLTLSVN